MRALISFSYFVDALREPFDVGLDIGSLSMTGRSGDDSSLP